MVSDGQGERELVITWKSNPDPNLLKMGERLRKAETKVKKAMSDLGEQYRVTQDWQNKALDCTKATNNMTRQIFNLDTEQRDQWSRGALKELGITMSTISSICD